MIARVIGSGTDNPILDLGGKSRRLCSSILIGNSILLDATSEVREQIPFPGNQIKDIILSRPHASAFRGLQEFSKNSMHVTVYGLQSTLEAVAGSGINLDGLDLVEVQPNQEFTVQSIEAKLIPLEYSLLNPLLKDSAAIMVGSILYAPAMNQDFFLSKRSSDLRNAISGSRIVFLNGGTITGKIDGKLNIFSIARELRELNPKRLYFIGIGSDCPKHERLASIVRRWSPRWNVAFDGASFDTEFVSEPLSELKNEALKLDESHTKMIWQGNKQMIVLPIEYKNSVGKSYYLVGGNNCYGIVKIVGCNPINIEQFNELESKHRMTEKERIMKWSEKKVLYSYNFEVLESFPIPRMVLLPNESGFFIESIAFMQSNLDKLANDLDKNSIELGLDNHVLIKNFASIEGDKDEKAVNLFFNDSKVVFPQEFYDLVEEKFFEGYFSGKNNLAEKSFELAKSYDLALIESTSEPKNEEQLQVLPFLALKPMKPKARYSELDDILDYMFGG